ncbi:hypothetical protein OG523_34940 [Streptomyces virginiae]|nr:DUF6777 domain-containing protein [Streptomyces virginiae]MCX4961078.1 hypothetical protein [Streptomyces virginiae]MCX5180949.1 hypothetical protein [Streptomyces virginiae]
MPRLATALVAVAAVVALAVVLTRPSGTTDNAGGEVFLQPVAASGPDPFTESTVVKDAPPPPESPPPSPQGTGTAQVSPSASPTGPVGTRSVSGSAPGVYGGTRNVASCDVEKLIGSLGADPAKNAAFASGLGIQPAAVPGYLRSLTSVQLRMDTRVTNNSYRDGKLVPYQAVLQAGTAVLVDDRGVPRVRCACGNPLGPPVALKAAPKRFGQTWPSYQPTKVVAIAPAPTVITKIVIYDHRDNQWYERPKGDHQGKPKPDRPIPPPPVPTPPLTPTPTVTNPRPSGTSPRPTPSGTSPTPSKSPSKSPSTSPSKSSSESPSKSPSTSPSKSSSPSPSESPKKSPSESPKPTPSESPKTTPAESPKASPSASSAESKSPSKPASQTPSTPPSAPSAQSPTPKSAPATTAAPASPTVAATPGSPAPRPQTSAAPPPPSAPPSAAPKPQPKPEPARTAPQRPEPEAPAQES